jgi:hypothetical protein
MQSLMAKRIPRPHRDGAASMSFCNAGGLSITRRGGCQGDANRNSECSHNGRVGVFKGYDDAYRGADPSTPNYDVEDSRSLPPRGLH